MIPKIIFSDFDGTLTQKGKLTTKLLNIFELCESRNIPFIIVSGRSQSWGHFLLTHTNIDCAIMEGGGVIIERGEDKTHFKQTYLVGEEETQKLARIAEEVTKKFNIPLSDDSLGRVTDRAVEFNDLEESFIGPLSKFFDENDVNYSLSNVHINFWCGDISKSKGCEKYLETLGNKIDKSECLFFGDACNDESMFKDFPNTVGVSNISRVLDKLEYKPKVILEGQSQANVDGVWYYLTELLK